MNNTKTKLKGLFSDMEGNKTKLKGLFGDIAGALNRASDAIWGFIERQAKLVNMNPILYVIMLIILAFTLIYVLWLSKYYKVAVEHYEDSNDAEEEAEDAESEVDVEEEVEEAEIEVEPPRPKVKTKPAYKAPERKRPYVVPKRALKSEPPSPPPAYRNPKQSLIGRVVEKFLAYLP